jgi:3-oxoacyl-[acyl-carrier-protein] synthase-1
MRSVYLQGRGLVSSLGADLSQAVNALERGAIAPKRIVLPGGTDWPYFGIDHAEADWRTRARQLIISAIAEAGVTACRNAPLFVASSSLEVGATESGVPCLDDCFSFAEQVAGWLRWTGPTYLVSTACISSLQAVLTAAKLIGSEVVDEAVVLGVELSNRFSISGFAAMQLLTPTVPKPLGAGRDGIALGEAVAVLHLSSAPARWRICGGNSCIDGRDPTGTLPTAVAHMCKQALVASGLEPSDIDLIKLQAAGGPVSDVNELTGLAEVFDSLPALVTLKAALGHTLGASGAAEIALLTAVLEKNVWPHVDYLSDPLCRAGLAVARPEWVRYFLAEILGFGGGYAAVIMQDTEASSSPVPKRGY